MSLSEVDCTCSLCQHILTDPILTGCCGASFCRHCIEVESSCSEGENNCPKCQLSNLSYIHDHRLDTAMKKMVIACRHREKGCVWTGSIFDLSNHLEEQDGCHFVTLPCPKKCGATIERISLREHLEAKCYINWTQCTHCKDLVPSTSIGIHLTTNCPQYEIACPNECNEVIKRSEMQAHRENCPNEIIQCPFKDAGCDIEAFKRSKLQEHLSSGNISHSLLMFGSVSEEIKQLKAKLQEIGNETQVQKREIRDLQKALDSSKQELAGVMDRNIMLASSLNQELEYISSQPHTASVKTLAISCLRDQLAFLSNPLLLKVYPTGPPLTFRMPHFSQLKTVNQPWVSLPFVVQNGYQMSIVVHPNGQGEGHSTHLSVYLHLIAGRYDDNLTWPLRFEDEIAISLMRQMPEANKGRGKKGSEPYNNEFVIQQRMRILVHMIHRVNRPIGELGLAFGFIALFCAQSTISGTSLYNDSLVFQLSILASRTKTLQ